MDPYAAENSDQLIFIPVPALGHHQQPAVYFQAVEAFLDKFFGNGEIRTQVPFPLYPL